MFNSTLFSFGQEANVVDWREIILDYAPMNENTFHNAPAEQWNHLIETVQAGLPKSFTQCHPVFRQGSGVVVATMGWMSVVVRENTVFGGYEATVGIVIEHGAKFHSLAKNSLEGFASELFVHLNEEYELRQRVSDTETSPYIDSLHRRFKNGEKSKWVDEFETKAGAFHYLAKLKGVKGKRLDQSPENKAYQAERCHFSTLELGAEESGTGESGLLGIRFDAC